jgi:hypothetical protein
VRELSRALDAKSYAVPAALSNLGSGSKPPRPGKAAAGREAGCDGVK